MRCYLCLAIVALYFAGCTEKEKKEKTAPVDYQTTCNPVDLSYRFQLELPSFREAADPSVVNFKGGYYMILSRSGGYFYSPDLIKWDLIAPQSDFPFEHYAPTAVAIGDALYFVTSGYGKMLKSHYPQSGNWEVVESKSRFDYADPALFLDDDGRLYYFGGCSPDNWLYGAEIDTKTFEIIGKTVPILISHREKYGWEVQGDYNLKTETPPWIEGSWVNKYKGKYYFQYAGPGTEFKSYNDGVYVADSPLGPYTLAEHNPFACRPEGYLPGVGHGSTFTDRYGNYWHIGTANVSMRHSFERRLALSPVFFDADGEMYAWTAFGDYPMIVPNRKLSSPEEFFPEWMLLSYNKKVSVSSTLKKTAEQEAKMAKWWNKPSNFEPINAVDEEIRTWWSAETGNKGEWFSVDLGEPCTVYALQINFADYDSDLLGARSGRTGNLYYQYTVEESSDGQNWKILIDKSQNTVKDAPHEYVQLNQPLATRYLRINNIRVPSGKFSLSDFRVFGKSSKAAPQQVTTGVATRGSDRRQVKLVWDKIPDATGYNIRFGTREGKLYQNYMVYNKNELQINILNTEKQYFFAIDAFNESGITKGKTFAADK
ncbi:MAG: family 43 glycosylhydrolase [Prevotellaceae bacterium]|nr:family 43 glycosylhydrolase [Prevotellaceae bacterium]